MIPVFVFTPRPIIAVTHCYRKGLEECVSTDECCGGCCYPSIRGRRAESYSLLLAAAAIDQPYHGIPAHSVCGSWLGCGE